MDHERFREWLSHVDELTAAQCKEVAAVLSDPPEGAASPSAANQSPGFLKARFEPLIPAIAKCCHGAL